MKNSLFSVEKLQEIQDELEKAELIMRAIFFICFYFIVPPNDPPPINQRESKDEVFEVEQRYNEIRKPVYDNQNDLINSLSEFWLTAFLSHPVLGDLLTEEDQKNFKPNPFFENSKLSKTYTVLEDGRTKITATTIKWKEGKGIPNEIVQEKKGNKRSHTEESEVNKKDDSDDDKNKVLEIQDEELDEEDFEDEGGESIFVVVSRVTRVDFRFCIVGEGYEDEDEDEEEEGNK
ncbi:hypothetical protein RND71_010355 [Anisodus tanguticus]|uniref:Uncharacterized protein n=1 Tax=Anisodus tanguticus TaxID=243964 RepID=A0AAE1SJK4_9SOLA|nr:hypothetical protein RND71_010355 [Anisodus tanguticus]